MFKNNNLNNLSKILDIENRVANIENTLLNNSMSKFNKIIGEVFFNNQWYAFRNSDIIEYYKDDVKLKRSDVNNGCFSSSYIEIWVPLNNIIFYNIKDDMNKLNKLKCVIQKNNKKDKK